MEVGFQTKEFLKSSYPSDRKGLVVMAFPLQIKPVQETKYRYSGKSDQIPSSLRAEGEAIPLLARDRFVVPPRDDNLDTYF